jgi:3-hydroxybutyrate dehydrogenase
MSVDLSGRRVLVTGGASGIGAACAAKFAAAAALVTVADLDAAGAQQVAEPLGAGFAGVDLADPSFDAAALSAGQDIVVNNAGIQHVSPVEEFPEEKFRQILALLLEAPFRLVRAALPHMYAQRWAGS